MLVRFPFPHDVKKGSSISAMGATISSYTWLCMIINFLQTRDPPVLPVLHQMSGFKSRNGKGMQSAFADDISSLRGYGEKNKESLGQLLFQYFRRYGYEIDYEKFVVSVRQGKLLTREAKGWPLERRLCVEEPFNTFRNLGNSADDYSFHGIHEELRRAFNMLSDGLKLDKCLEQYVFPPLEKATFKKPEPKPKPILSRSHSQTRRNLNADGPSNLNFGFRGKQPPHQRNGPTGRRSSSGATFGQPRHQYAQSPPIGVHNNEYFEPSTLHSQLLHQFQMLNIQENMLKAQMAQAQAHPMPGHLSGGRGMAPNNPRSVTSNPSGSRRGTVGESSQQDTLPPGLLYHFPVNYPRPQMAPQPGQRDGSGTNTNPSSPSLMAAVPALHRVHRSSANDGSAAASVRSHSQPGRSTPNPMAVHAYAHPGFDVSGAIGHPMGRAMPGFMPQGQNGIAGRFPQVPGFSGPAVDPGVAKEYVGYYFGESPQLMPQYSAASMVTAPPYVDAPTRRRRVSPDLAPPEGLSRSSRSPSPLARSRTYSNGLHSAPLPGYVPSILPQQEPVDVAEPNADEPPPIANGSFRATPLANNNYGFDQRDSGPPSLSNRNFAQLPKMPEFGDFGSSANELPTHLLNSSSNNENPEEQYTITSQEPQFGNGNDVRSNQKSNVEQIVPPTSGQAQPIVYHQNSPLVSEMPQGEPNMVANGLDSHQLQDVDGAGTSRTVLDRVNESRPVPVPQLSPVFETQSPSPIISRRLESGSGGHGTTGSKPNMNGSLKENQTFQQDDSSRIHERTPSQSSSKGITTSTPAALASKPTTFANGYTNGWQQQKSKKGGRRNVNVDEERGRLGTGGEPLPLNESERKGG